MKSLCLVWVLALAAPQDKITLAFNPKKGDRLVRSETSGMSMKARIVAGDQEQVIEFEQKESEKSSLEYADVADGKLTRSIYKCQENVEEKKGPPSLQWEKREKPLQGRTITMSLKDGKLVREGADGLDEKMLKKLDLYDRTSLIFPKTAVAAGESWGVEGDDARKFLAADTEIKEAKIKVKLLAVKDIEGRRCAVLNAVLELSGKADGDLEMTLKLDVEVVVWIERGYALSVRGKGSLTMKGENAQFKMSGQGPMSLEITTKVE